MESKCGCKYFEYRGGVLCCSVCGKPAKTSQPAIEDKIGPQPEVKVSVNTQQKKRR